jgi:hypothetical protein
VISAVENRAVVELRPVGPPTPGPTPDWLVRQVVVESSRDVEGYPNLLAAGLPREMKALVRTSMIADLGAADRWRVEASLVGPNQLRIERKVS